MTTDLWDSDYGTGEQGFLGRIRNLVQSAYAAIPQQSGISSTAVAQPDFSPQPQLPEPELPTYEPAFASADVGVAPPEYGPEFPVLNEPVPQGNNLWDTISSVVPDRSPQGPTPLQQAVSTDIPYGSELRGFTGGALGELGSWYDAYRRATGDTGNMVGGSAESVGQSIGQEVWPRNMAEAALSPLLGFTPADDLLKGAGRAALGTGADYIDNAARLGADFIPEGAVGRTIAPPAQFDAGPVRGISPTEGYDIARVAGGAETPEEIARRAEIERLSREWMSTMGTPNTPPDPFAGEAPIGGSAETGWVRNTLPPEPPSPPTTQPPAQPPIPGAASGRPISYAGTDFAPTQPMFESPGPLFDTPPATGTTPSAAPLSPNMQAQVADLNTRQIVSGLPEDAQGQVTDFIRVARQQLEARPVDTNVGRRLTAPISGNLQSPFADELVNQENQLRQIAWSSLASPPKRFNVASVATPEELSRWYDGSAKVRAGGNDAISESEWIWRDSFEDRVYEAERNFQPRALDSEAAKEIVDETQKRFRKQMLDEKFGTTPTEARKAVEETLKEGDRRRMTAGLAGKIYDGASDILKQVTLGLDIFAAGGQQGLRAVRGGPSVVAGMINRFIQSAGFDTGIWQGDHVAQMLADGLPIGRTAAGLNDKSLLRRIPGVGPLADNVTSAQFAVLDQVGMLSYEGQLLVNKVLHDIPVIGKLLGGDILDPQVRRNIARHAATVRSSSMAPTGTRRAGLERRSLLSAPMTRAQFNEVLTFFQDPTRPENRLAALNLIGGTAAMIGAGKLIHDQMGAEGSTYETNPFSPNVGQITTKFKNADGQNIIISVMPQRSIPNGALLAAEAALEGDPNGTLEAITRAGVGRANVLPADILRLAPRAGYDESGFNIDLPSGDALKASIPVPLSYQDQIMRGDLSLNTAVANQAGLSNRGESPYEAYDRQFTRVTGQKLEDLLPGEAFDLVQQNPDLKTAYDNWQQSRDTATAAISREKYDALGAAAPLLETQPQDYREAVGNAVDTARAKYEQAKADGKVPDFNQKGIRKAYDDFFEAIAPASADGKVDYDLQERLATEYLDSLDSTTKDRILKELTFSPDEQYRGLLEARQQLKSYFAIIDQDWKEAQQKTPKLASYDSADEYITDQQRKFMERGISRDEARDMATELAGIYTGDARDKQEIYLLKNRELLPILHKYGYYIPADLKNLATITR